MTITQETEKCAKQSIEQVGVLLVEGSNVLGICRLEHELRLKG